MNHVMAMDTDKPSPDPTPLAPLIIDRQHQDPFIVILSQLDLESVVNTLMTNKATASNTELWKFFAEFHGVSAGEGQSDQDAMLRAPRTLRNMKQKMMSETFTSVNLKPLLEETTKQPYLWSALLELLPQIHVESLPDIYNYIIVENAQCSLNHDAFSRQGMFEGIPAEKRQAYLEKIVTRGTFGAEQAQKYLSLDASLGSDFFEDKTAAERRTYLENIVTRGTFGAQQAQEFLNGDAYSGKGLFGGIPAEERRTYLEWIVARGAFGAEDAQRMLKKLQTNN